jgi:hypothetical protein
MSCYEPLRPGGGFAIDVAPRYNDRLTCLSRSPENRRALPEAWPASPGRTPMADGGELELVARTVAVNHDHTAAVSAAPINWRRLNHPIAT